MRGAGVQVLVVGAGIAGLAAARTLSQWGATVEMVERAPGQARHGAGIYLPGNAVRALDALGLATQVAARGMAIQRQQVADHRGRPLFGFDTDDVWDRVGASLAVHRADLHEALLSGAKDVPIRWACAPLSIEDTPQDVRVRFSDGTDGRYDLVVGADGVHSAVRRLVFGGGAHRFVGQYARRFVTAWPDAAPVWSLMLGRRAVFLTIPVGGGQVYCYVDEPLTDSPAPLRDLLAGFAEPVPTLLHSLAAREAAIQGGPNEEVVPGPWSRGLVLLVGDAAHATSPNMAEGAGMAFEDALVLPEALSAAASIPEALRAFERRRRARTDWVLAQTHRRDRSRGLPPAVRNFVLSRYGSRMFHAHYHPLRAAP
jgi:FAD-dependent urate hydroxylase